MKELIVFEEVDAVEIFQGAGMPELLERINTEARSLVPDVSTEEGRDAIKKNAAKVGKCATYLDSKGKEIVDELKKQPKIIDGVRKQMRDFLGDVKVDVLKPFTEWKETEEKRIDGIKNRLAQIIEFGTQARDLWMNMAQAELDGYFEAINSMPEGSYWEEFEDEYEVEHQKAYDLVSTARANRKKFDEEAAELEVLRAIAAKREKEDQDAKIKKEAEENARLKIEAETRENSERIERERLEAIKERETAELRLTEAKEKSAQDLIDAEARIKRENEQKAAKDKAEAEAREANTKHRGKINTAAAKAMQDVLMSYDSGERSLTLGQAKLIVKAIAQDKVPNVKIFY